MVRVGATLRVGLDVTALIGRRTGIGQVVAGMVDALEARSDVDVVRFAMTWRGRGESGATHRGLPARPMRALWRRVDHPRLERWTGAIDVVHGTNYVVPPTRAARVVSVHDVTFLRFPQLVTSDVAAYEGLVRRAVRRGAWVHTDSQFVADEVRAWLGSAVGDRVRAIAPGPTWPSAGRSGSGTDDAPSMGCDGHSVGAVEPGPSGSVGNGAIGVEPGATVSVSAGSTEAERGAAESGGGPMVLMLGTIEPRKDIVSVVRAWADVIREVPSARLGIAGAVGPLGSGEVDDAIAALPSLIRSSVARMGFVPDAAGLLRRTAVLVYPSVYEGYGLPPLEAMAAGVPVVSSTAGSLPEVLAGAALLVEPRQPERLAGAIVRVLTDAAYCDALVAAGFARVAAQPSWATHADELVRMYRDASA